MRLNLYTSRSPEACRAALEAALAPPHPTLRGRLRDDASFLVCDWLGPQLGTVIQGHIAETQDGGAHVEGYVGIAQWFYLAGMVGLVLPIIHTWLLVVVPPALVGLWAILMWQGTRLRKRVEGLLLVAGETSAIDPDTTRGQPGVDDSPAVDSPQD